MRRIGENLNEVSAQNGSQEEHFEMVRMHDLNPLLFGQKAQITALEQENSMFRSNIDDLEAFQHNNEVKHQAELSTFESAHRDILHSYQTNLVEMASQKRQLHQEREDCNKTEHLIKAANESTETLNIELKRRVSDLESIADQRNTIIS